MMFMRTTRQDKKKTFLTTTSKERQTAKLQMKTNLSHDTRLFRFALPQPKMVLGLPVGKHLRIWCPNPTADANKGKTWNGKEDAESGNAEIERKYTPTSSDEDEGHFDLIIKVYKPNDRFADGGKMSQWMERLEVGDSISLSGPWGLIEYCGMGLFKKGKNEIQVEEVGMICGGTGITPMLQIIESILRNREDPTEISLLYANQTEADILCRARLEELQRENKKRFKVWYTLDRAPEQGWKYSEGFVSKEMIQERMPPPSKSSAILICGPPPMLKFAVHPNLDALAYDKDRRLEF